MRKNEEKWQESMWGKNNDDWKKRRNVLETKKRKEEKSRGGWRRAGSEKAQERGKMLGKIVRGRGERWVI